ncbi:GGDEF domain-containing protein [Streptomyces sp. NP160]|uniref:GGDEF domain-containing protein n=1 Tax=Streptomyces sp. NP160 TaxID=2586637 RepID=UPI0011191E5C|nr:GGDEF domain-containing protein [Streptomyces sp. NP160]TNM68129.1 GGDEF domain-containing protein [Streptomyces sp. NP160]
MSSQQFRRAGALWDSLVARTGQPAATGLVLLLLTGAIVTLTSPFHMLTGGQAHQTRLLGGVMTAVVLVCTVLPWRRWPDHAAMVFPVVTLLGLSALSAAATGLGAAYIGIFVLAFVYVGLFLPVHSCWLLLPVAVVLYGPTMGGWTREIVLRLVVVALVWLLTAEVLAALIARHRAALDALHAASRTDLLTRLENRRALQDHLQATPAGTVFVVCDLDHFKRVNDTRGHAHGDRVLAEFARVLRQSTRQGDHAVRYGGEEFLWVLQADASHVPRLLAGLHQAWSLSQARITFSCGWAVHNDQRSVQATLAAADSALYEAKRTGRDRDVAEAMTSTPSR